MNQIYFLKYIQFNILDCFFYSFGQVWHYVLHKCGESLNIAVTLGTLHVCIFFSINIILLDDGIW